VAVGVEKHGAAAAPESERRVARRPDTVIEPRRGLSFRLRELWRYRELTWYLILRSVKPRYRQTVLGFGWALLPPVMAMVVFSVFLNGVAGVKSEAGIPYPIFSFSGLLLWQYFAGAASRGSTSLLANASFVTKVFFPRVLVPLATVLDALFDLAVAFVVLIPLMAWYGLHPGWEVVTLPLFVLLAVATALGVSLLVNSLGITYRDFGLAVPIFIQLGLFATPVVYPLSAFSEPWRGIIQIVNPMASAVTGFRWAILGTGPAPDWHVAASVPIALVLLAAGLLLFNRREGTFADEI
jgi:lipopolysaccharide transport system permease protein